jgi:hypothetical protein
MPMALKRSLEQRLQIFIASYFNTFSGLFPGLEK